MNAGEYTIDAHCWPKADGYRGLLGSFECDISMETQLPAIISETQAVSVTFYRYVRDNPEQSTDLAQHVFFPGDGGAKLMFMCYDNSDFQSVAWEMRYYPANPFDAPMRLASGTDVPISESDSAHLFYNTNLNESYSAIQYVWYDPDSTQNTGCSVMVKDVQTHNYLPPPAPPSSSSRTLSSEPEVTTQAGADIPTSEFN